MDSLLKSQEGPENMTMMVVYFTIGTFEDRQNQQGQQPPAISLHPCQYRLVFTVSEKILSNYGKTATIESKIDENFRLLSDDILSMEQIDKKLELNNPIMYDNDNDTRLIYNIGSMCHVNVVLNPAQIHCDTNQWEYVLNKLGNLSKNGQNEDITAIDMVVNDGTMEASAYIPN